MKFKYSVAIFWLFLFALAVGAYMIFSAQDITRASFIKNEGIDISAEEEKDIKPIELDIVSQQDARWAMKIMCDDLSIRICEYGSQLCCTSSIYALFDRYITPDKMYDQFAESGLYSFDGSSTFCDVRYEYMQHAYNLTFESPRIQSKTIFDSETVISLLEAGTPVMVRVTHPLLNRFWVVITGIEDGEFIIMDPLEEEYGKLSTYNNKIYQLVYFE